MGKKKKNDQKRKSTNAHYKYRPHVPYAKNHLKILKCEGEICKQSSHRIRLGVRVLHEDWR